MRTRPMEHFRTRTAKTAWPPRVEAPTRLRRLIGEFWSSRRRQERGFQLLDRVGTHYRSTSMRAAPKERCPGRPYSSVP